MDFHKEEKMANPKFSRVRGLIPQIAALAFALFIGQLVMAQGGGPTAFVDDSCMVRSDGRGIYVDNIACVSVIAGSGGGGFFQLRTVHNSDLCNLQTWGERRFLTLDFGSAITWDLDLDPNDLNPAVEEVPARFIASKAYAKRAVTTPVSIFILKVNADGTTTQDTAWELRYRNEASVAIYPDGSRIISLLPAFATADLYEIVQVIKKGRVTTQAEYRGTYQMPFSVTATMN
jgi:hypothetical protein